ncbi:hypothetical protein [Pseudomonas asiatica]|uniref:Peptidase M41 domain-containing protein n=1 Tax=Pseudomonas asiatica TaxID=2219225 RepID=A0ABU5KVY5_9PSED|nr:hypothetical protein [Pseudomonas asiatica]MDZ5738052.1 hypothetical protein [Pseudomonas asiatica]MDZ5744648.1 hypothetical protein [Pseudomonas asiatica]MDZ5748808.1 hypothetical protein [Pseudomonas asiatica]MDZ5753140.1 hypothetical protein [Pseudomonas asiatica]
MSFVDVRLKVLKHELGHWLVSRHVGFRAGDIQITIFKGEVKKGVNEYQQDGSSMVFTAPVLNTIDDLKDYLDRRFQVLYAGIAAQIHGQAMTPEESGRIMELDAAGDLRIIRELVPMLRGSVYGPEISPEVSEKQIQELLDPNWNKTKSLVADLYPKIEWMAKTLSPFIKAHGRLYNFPLSLLEDTEQHYVAGPGSV